MWQADLRFGAGVSSELFNDLAVSLIPHQGELSYQLRAGHTHKHTQTYMHRLANCQRENSSLTSNCVCVCVVTLRKVLTTSCSVEPLNGESPMKRITATQITHQGHTREHYLSLE